MTNTSLLARLSRQQLSGAMVRCVAAGAEVAILLLMTGAAQAQTPAPGAEGATSTSQMSIPSGYVSHSTVDIGGRIADKTGSHDMYDTLVNLQTGPRIVQQTFTMHALPGKKNTILDDLTAMSSGFGGDPYNYARLTASKGKIYEFTGLFRRDRLYSDYDLLANPNILPGQTINNMVAGRAVAAASWPLVNNSPVKFNTVRRMTDTNLTLYPLSKWSVRFAYSHSTMEGPTLSPSYTLFGMKYNANLMQWERNGNDDFQGAVDWKPRPDTRISFEMDGNHYKSDTFYTLDPNQIFVQEADGTPAYLGNYTSFAPYGISVSAACNTTSMGSGFTNATNYTILSAANKPGGLPIVNPACAVVTGYYRSAPWRTWTPTGTIRLQSTALKNFSMNGKIYYTFGRMDEANYYESSQGLNGAVRSAISTGGQGRAHRDVFGANYAIVWQITPTFSLGDQVDYVNIQEPSNTIIPAPATLSTPAAPNQTINFAGVLTPGTGTLPHGINGTLTPNFYGEEYVNNNAIFTWDPMARARLTFTYRFKNRNIGQGIPHTGPIPLVPNDPVNGNIAITENAGVFNAALRPAKNWEVNGTVEAGYADNAFTAVGMRQFRQYRLHTLWRPKNWITASGGYTDRERHNNTNNNQDVVGAGDANYSGPIRHVDYFRIGAVNVTMAPNERYSVNFNYTYNDFYAATNTCYANGAAPASATTPAVPGAAQVTSGGAPNLCAGDATWLARDFEHAPTQFGIVSIAYAPVNKFKTNVGYSISAVNGSRFFNDARDVNGSMISTYQTPFLNVAYTMRPGLVWKAEYNFYGYGEGGVSGAPLCTTSAVSATAPTATIVPCNSATLPANSTALLIGPTGATAPRNFHANNVTLGIHYEF